MRRARRSSPGPDRLDARPGSCRIGDDPERAATDRNGQVHGVEGLYVGDSSLIPRRFGQPVPDDHGPRDAARRPPRRAMRAAQLSEYHRPLELIEAPEPEPVAPRRRRQGRRRGRVRRDLHAQEGLMEPAGLKPKIVLGHENAGWVHLVGRDVTTAKPGDAVLVYPPYSCGLCVDCRRGLDMHCDRHQFYGLTRDGGFADYVLVDEH